MVDADEPQPTQHLELRWEEWRPRQPDYPVVTILVDGENVLSGGQADWIGFDPAEIFGPESPLVPTNPARRVAVYRCNCGEPGCGCVAPLIFERDGRVLWSDFRNFTGVYSKPTVARLPVGGKGLGFPDLHFDAQQYRAEVARATLDRSWETKARETARLLHECLDQGHDQLARQGWRSSWVSPHHQKANMFRVAFWDLDARHQVVVEVTAEPAPSPEQAELMARFLLQTPPENWPVTFRGFRRSDKHPDDR
jgi:hypothetical protein